jgi:hypothetical protein
MNNLSHTIPNDIGSTHILEELRLAHNNLSGSIPTILQNFTSLVILDLSFNNLQGEVPKEGIFRLLTNLSLAGNNELCGGILICTLLLLVFVVALVQLIHKKFRRSQKSPLLSPTIKDWHEKVSYHALEKGTNKFSEANLLGKGTFGAVYKCTFQGDETIAAVKVFNLEQSGSDRSFVAECEALRRVHHRCLIKIITCCSSINHQGQEFKALVFEFMPNGNLNGWLHLKSGMPTPRNTLSLVQRLDIAVDIIDALDYLHNHCQPPIVHCDIKPSNILLTDNMSARVADFGISRILPEIASKNIQYPNSLNGIRGSIGYVAPGN